MNRESRTTESLTPLTPVTAPPLRGSDRFKPRHWPSGISSALRSPPKWLLLSLSVAVIVVTGLLKQEDSIVKRSSSGADGFMDSERFSGSLLGILKNLLSNLIWAMTVAYRSRKLGNWSAHFWLGSWTMAASSFRILKWNYEHAAYGSCLNLAMTRSVILIPALARPSWRLGCTIRHTPTRVVRKSHGGNPWQE